MAATPGGEANPDVYQRLLQNRIVFLGTQVDHNSANLICAQLLLLEAEDPGADISLYINSPGGSVTDGLGIYDTMQYVRCDVSTICLGLAASMGQFLLCAGAPGKRFALPHSRILMHQPSGQMQGQAADIAIQAEQIIYLKRMMAERISFHTGQPVERIEADSDRDRWFTADEALEYGFIDKVLDRSSVFRFALTGDPDPSHGAVSGPSPGPLGQISSEVRDIKASIPLADQGRDVASGARTGPSGCKLVAFVGGVLAPVCLARGFQCLGGSSELGARVAFASVPDFGLSETPRSCIRAGRPRSAYVRPDVTIPFVAPPTII